jgi:GTP-binding nuclear protein Ran
MSVPSFKLVIVGDSGVGKTQFIQRHLVGGFEKRRVEDLGQTADVYPCTFMTSMGPICFNCVDRVGKAVPIDEFYIGAHCAIIMFDVTSRDTYNNVPNRWRDIARICENIPIVLVGNKVDCADRTVRAKMITFHRKKNLQYYDVSGKANYNYEKPFLWIARRLANDANLQFVEPPPLAPPDVLMNSDLVKAMEAALIDSATICMPDGEY